MPSTGRLKPLRIKVDLAEQLEDAEHRAAGAA
jgi:hypothetical protein